MIATRSGSHDARRTTARPDAEGRFRLRGVQPGTWTLDVMAAGDGARVTVELSENGKKEVEIRLAGGRTVAGSVVSPRGSVAAAALYLITEIEQVYPLAPVKTGPLGEFSTRLPRDAGRVNVLVMPPGYAARILSLPLPSDGAPLDDVAIPVGEVAGMLRLELPATADEGIELRRGPTRVHLTLLRTWAGYHGSRPQSVWELPAMEPGAYELCSRHACDSGALGPGDTLVLRLAGDEEEPAEANPPS